MLLLVCFEPGCEGPAILVPAPEAEKGVRRNEIPNTQARRKRQLYTLHSLNPSASNSP